MNQAELEANTRGFGLVSDWEGGVSFLNQSESVVKQNRSKRMFTCDTQLKTALYKWTKSKYKVNWCIHGDWYDAIKTIPIPGESR